MKLTKLEQAFKDIFQTIKNNNTEKQKEKIHKLINNGKDVIYDSLVDNFIHCLKKEAKSSIDFIEGEKNLNTIVWDFKTDSANNFQKHFSEYAIKQMLNKVVEDFNENFKKYGSTHDVHVLSSVFRDECYVHCKFKTNLNLLYPIVEQGKIIFETSTLKSHYVKEHQKKKPTML